MQTSTAQVFLFIYFIFRLETVCSCEAGWISFDNSCYKYVATKANWQDARTVCLNMGADLVVVKDEEENTFLYNHFETHLWIGLTDIDNENDFIWVDSGECSNYTNFDSGEPNNNGEEDCTFLIYTHSARWNDAPCDILLAYVCETFLSCEAGWISFGNSCYKYVATEANWQDARTVCLNMGADLVVVKDEEENEFLYNQHNETVLWIGLTDIDNENDFKWVDSGKCSKYTNYRPCEPNDYGNNEDCVNLLNSGEWNDFPCTALRAYVCEKSIFQDTTPPSYGSSCPNDIAVPSSPSERLVSVYWTPPTWTDDSSCNVNETSSHSPGHVIKIPDGVLGAFINVTYSAIDMAGHSTTCEFRVSALRIQPYNHCVNGGTMAVSEGNTFSCICAPGFSGIHCEINAICVSNPCKNNGTCAFYPISTLGYRCFCSEWYSGHSCQEYHVPASASYTVLTIGMFFVGFFVGAFGLFAGSVGYMKIKQKKLVDKSLITDTRRQDTRMEYMAYTGKEKSIYQDLQHKKEETAYVNVKPGKNKK